MQVGGGGGFSPGKLRIMLLGVEKKRKEQEGSESTFNLRSQASDSERTGWFFFLLIFKW